MRMCIYRSSRLKVFCKNGVLRNFSGNFKENHLCQSPFFNKVAKIETLSQVYFYEFCEIAKNTLFYRTPLVAASVYTNVYMYPHTCTQACKYIYTYIYCLMEFVESSKALLSIPTLTFYCKSSHAKIIEIGIIYRQL